MDLASVVAALTSVGVRVSGSTPNNNVQGDSSRACPTGLAGPEPSGTINDPGQHFHPIVWLCDQEPAKSFQIGPPPEKAKLKRWWTYLSQFRLTVHHIPGIRNELSDYISRNNFDALIGESSEALAKEAFQRMDVQLDLSMRTAGILEGWSLTEYQSEYEEILQTLSTGLEPRVIDGHQWYKTNQYPGTL